MKNFTPLLLALLLTAMANGQALAKDANPFAGPYVGVETGYESYPADLDGATVGAIAGYNLAAGDFLIGLEARYAKPFAKDTTVTDLGLRTATTKLELNNQIGGSLRLGYRASDNVAIFGSVGGERFDVDAVRTVRPKPNCAPAAQCTTTATDFSFNEEMLVLGADVEWRFADQWRLRAGYRYSDGDAYDRNSAAVALIYAF